MRRDAATQAQVNAADPKRSTWLSANAGSGKTRVLTDRVARLLFDEVEPQNILCLTYTKAAAAEMQNRLFKRLGGWAMLDDETLREDLRRLGVDETITSNDLSRARTLFARAIETPGGLKIQTIHSFCASVLRRFPLEAQISPQFKEMEDRTATLLRTEVLDALVEGPHAAAAIGFLRFYTDIRLDDVLADIARNKRYFAKAFDEASLRKELGLSQSVETRDIFDAIFDAGNVQTITEVAKICHGGSSTDVKAATKLLEIDGQNPTYRDIETLEGLFLFGEKAKSPFGAKVDAFPTKKTRQAHPALTADLNDLMELVAESRVVRLSLLALEKTRALYAFASKFIAAYEMRKVEMGMLDFDDLIEKARQLLSDSAVADWVLFRLDGGIDHLLVDEAQDTSPTQWAVIRSLTEQFGSGHGARSNEARTLFVVGDKKQSIYSFQGADPEEFDRMKAHFDSQLEQVGGSLADMELAHSFRSSKAILKVVDETFRPQEIIGLGGPSNHIAFKENMPGRVDLWPVVEPIKADKDDSDWTKPVDTVSDAHHTVRMANQVAAEIKRMTREEFLPVEVGNSDTYTRRPVTEGDILILVQRRSELFHELIRACKEQGLNIAGADRMVVGAELAVKDIAALLQFLALPEDDLSLACALRSPLFGWSEQELFTLAHHRTEQFLWPALRSATNHDDTLSILHDLRRNADFMRPYDLIERILTRHGGRKKLLARLGQEAEDGIDALLSQALAYESQGVPSLTGFLAWMQADNLEVKRQIDGQSDQIRVMTVHGAKGLEAPIVFLPETAKRPNTVRDQFLKTDDQLLWKTAAAQTSKAVAAFAANIQDAQSRERMRLLYVAMTRAEKWLIVGASGDVKDDDDSWYNIISDGMDRAGWVDAKAGGTEIKRVSYADWDAGPVAQQQPSTVAAPIAPAFDLLPDIAVTDIRSPSDLGGAKVVAGDPSSDDPDVALARGRILHSLLEHLPAVSHADRFDFAVNLINGHPDALDASDELIHDAIKLIDAPHLSHVFDSGSLAEVDIAADLTATHGFRVLGAIDRLVVEDARVLAVDFKSNRLVPKVAEDTPDGLLRQMGAYHAALAQIFPDHQIEVAILWTADAQLMPLPTSLVSNALAAVSAP